MSNRMSVISRVLGRESARLSIKVKEFRELNQVMFNEESRKEALNRLATMAGEFGVAFDPEQPDTNSIIKAIDKQAFDLRDAMYALHNPREYVAISTQEEAPLRQVRLEDLEEFLTGKIDHEYDSDGFERQPLTQMRVYPIFDILTYMPVIEQSYKNSDITFDRDFSNEEDEWVLMVDGTEKDTYTKRDDAVEDIRALLETGTDPDEICMTKRHTKDYQISVEPARSVIKLEVMP